MDSVDNITNSEKPKILLVDDREDNLLSIEAILEPDGYQFFRAYSGQQALKVLLNEFDFAMILMDVKMPVLNGFETATLIYEREKLRHIPIIFITANNYGDENIFKGFKAGGIDYIFKPINPEVLRAKVAIFIDIYRKNMQLILQEQKLSDANKGLTNEITELKASEEKVKQRNAQLQKEIFDLVSILLSSKPADQFKFEQSDLSGLINTLLADMDDQGKQKTATVVVEPLPHLKVNRILMRPLFQQLIRNVLDSSCEARPIIKIRSKIGAPANVLNSKTPNDNNYCQIIVEDDVEQVDRKSKDEGFTRADQFLTNGDLSKTNNGLVFCKEIMDRHNGFIHTRKKPDKSTMFIVSFPLEKEIKTIGT
jgi:CheY-like chemotaxis protein